MPSSEVPPVEGSQPSTWARRMWRSLSVANIWACGVAAGEHNWGMSLVATFFALACWYFSDVDFTAALASEPTRDEERAG